MEFEPFTFELEPVALGAAERAARARQATLTKPVGALGRMEDLAVRIAALQGTEQPTFENVAAIVFAADHGVTAHKISAYPVDVTAQMVTNFITGGAAISVMAKALDMDLEVVDVGVASDPAPASTDGPRRFVVDKVANGTRDFTDAPAMDVEQLHASLHAGARAVERVLAASSRQPVHGLVFGDMGIGNTTSASAIASVLLRAEPRKMVGAGTGLGEKGQLRKADVIGRAIEAHGLRGKAEDPLEVLRCVGGFEIAALVGAAFAAARNKVVIVVDGFIASTAMLIATRLAAEIRPWMLFAHISGEPGHHHVLEAVHSLALFDLKMRLGEGTGAALAVPFIRLACTLQNEMATFDEAAVSQRRIPKP